MVSRGVSTSIEVAFDWRLILLQTERYIPLIRLPIAKINAKKKKKTVPGHSVVHYAPLGRFFNAKKKGLGRELNPGPPPTGHMMFATW